MLNCKLDGKVIYCWEYIGFDEKIGVDKIIELKKLSREGRLFCCDDDCGQPVEFCHGEIKGSYFRHRKGCAETCEYNEYSNGRKSFDRLKKLLSEQFSRLGYEVEIDKKLLPNHWTDLTVGFPNGKKAAVELTDRRSGGMDMIDYSEQYESLGIADLWIIQEDPSDRENVLDMYTADMFQHIKSRQKSVVYFDTEREIFIVKSDAEFNVRFPHLLPSRFITVELRIEDIEIDDGGNLAGKYMSEYRRQYANIMNEYAAAERYELQRLKRQEENRKRQAEEARRQEELRQQRIKEYEKMQAIERQKAAKKIEEEKLRKEQLERQKDISFETERIPKIMSVLETQGIVIEQNKFDQFVENNKNWLKNAYIEGKDDHILVSKYKNS